MLYFWNRTHKIFIIILPLVGTVWSLQKNCKPLEDSAWIFLIPSVCVCLSCFVKTCRVDLTCTLAEKEEFHLSLMFQGAFFLLSQWTPVLRVWVDIIPSLSSLSCPKDVTVVYCLKTQTHNFFNLSGQVTSDIFQKCPRNLREEGGRGKAEVTKRQSGILALCCCRTPRSRLWWWVGTPSIPNVWHLGSGFHYPLGNWHGIYPVANDGVLIPSCHAIYPDFHTVKHLNRNP